MEIWETFGFAPCLIVGLAMLLRPRPWGRRRWRVLVFVWVFLWLGVMLWLIDRTRTPEKPEGYLDGRHTLILQFILQCLFALALQIWMRPMVWWQNFWRRKAAWERLPAVLRWGRWPYVFSAGVLVLGCLPGAIMLREPPSHDRVYLREAARWLERNTREDAVIACREPTLSYYSNRGYFDWGGRNTDEELLNQSRANPNRERLVIACIFQLERGEIPPERLGDCAAVARFDSPESLHHNVLVVYLPRGSGAMGGR
jgi:hypothetical protein